MHGLPCSFKQEPDNECQLRYLKLQPRISLPRGPMCLCPLPHSNTLPNKRKWTEKFCVLHILHEKKGTAR